jgi:hypothetical protein
MAYAHSFNIAATQAAGDKPVDITAAINALKL